MTFRGPKAAGKCIACAEPVREIISEFPEGHPLAGLPNRLGARLETMSEVRVLLSNGSYMDLWFCTTCAPQIRPQHFRAIWRVVVDDEDRHARARGEPATPNVFVSRMTKWMAMYPIAVLLRHRRVDGWRVIDRREAAA